MNHSSNNTTKKSVALSETIIETVKVLEQVTAGKSFNDEFVDKKLSPSTKHWLYETLRRYAWAQSSILNYLQLPTGKKPDPKVFNLLMVAIVMLEFDRHKGMIVSQAVEVGKKIRNHNNNFGGLVNGVLRNYIRCKNSPETKQVQSEFYAEEIKYWHPQWWIHMLKKEFIDNHATILLANNSHPTQTLRVNLLQFSNAKYQEKLTEAGIEFEVLNEVYIWDYQQAKIVLEKNKIKNEAIKIVQPLPIDKIPEFMNGGVSLQDFAAQRALSHLDIQDGQLILDACAAPGGKACHIAEYSNLQNYKNKIIALEKSSERAKKITENKERLTLDFEIKVGDLMDNDFSVGHLFDRILLDAPCSGSSSVRRHPDGKWQRRKSDLAKFGHEQLKMLFRAWQLLKPQGVLVYATCSSFALENEGVLLEFISKLIKEHNQKIQSSPPSLADFQKKLSNNLEIDKNIEKLSGMQLNQTILDLQNTDLTHYGVIIKVVEKIVVNNNHDGHFYAVLQKL